MTEEIPVDPVLRARNRRNLVLLFGLGLGPLLIAYFVYFFFPGLLPSDRSNQGALILPPVTAESLGLSNPDRKWVLTIPVGANCDEACASRFYYARQVNVALGKESSRVTRLLVRTVPGADTRTLVQEYPDLQQAEVPEKAWREVFGEQFPDPVKGNYIYLMDPNGNIMMVFTLEQAGKPMLKDVKHLLKVSNIG